jgi:hypothetical protein
MDMNKTYSKIEEKLDSDICELLKKPNMSRDELMMLGQAVDILKDISTVKAMDVYGGNEDDYSSASLASRAMTRRSMDYSRGYEDGMSMAQNRSPRTGRFVSGNDGWDVHPNGYDGRSGHSINDRMIDNIERMYDNAGTEHERAEIQDVINYIRRKGMNA